MIDGHFVGYNEVKPRQVDNDLTEELLRLGFDAWKASIGYRRPDDQLRTMFPYDTSDGVSVKREQFTDFAKHGSLIIATDRCDDSILGYAMGRNDVSGGLLARTYKRIAEREKVYAWMTQVAVDPEYQHNGIGRRLVRNTLENFKPKQHVTAYVFEENQIMMRAMKQLGFDKNPYNQPGRDMHDYFGADADPVKQFRFQADSVEDVIVRIDASLEIT